MPCNYHTAYTTLARLRTGENKKIMADRPARTKRLRVLMEALLSSDDEDDPPSPSRRDEYGRHCRRGGWHPTAQQNPVDGVGLSRWRHNWRGSKLWKMLQDTRTYDEGAHMGKLFRSRTAVPRRLFDVLVEEAKGYSELPTHVAGDGLKVRGPSCYPLIVTR